MVAQVDPKWGKISCRWKNWYIRILHFVSIIVPCIFEYFWHHGEIELEVNRVVHSWSPRVLWPLFEKGFWNSLWITSQLRSSDAFPEIRKSNQEHSKRLQCFSTTSKTVVFVQRGATREPHLNLSKSSPTFARNSFWSVHYAYVMNISSFQSEWCNFHIS